QGASSFQAIRDTRCAPPARWRTKLLRTLAQAYARAPERSRVLALVEDVLASAETHSIRDLAVVSIQKVCDYAGITTQLVPSSTVYGNAALSGVERVLDVCRREGATTYVNAAGGRVLYDHDRFAAHGVELLFSEAVFEPYPQLHTSEFVPGLSILDLLMHVDAADVARRLRAGREIP
ncbi:MAG: WbqC family protein, partial [Polyangiales bacterium]